VKKWVDYSAKYGLGMTTSCVCVILVGYLLTTGAVGVCFNDGSKIVLNIGGEYMIRDREW
jgi:hypothetical protein